MVVKSNHRVVSAHKPRKIISFLINSLPDMGTWLAVCLLCQCVKVTAIKDGAVEEKNSTVQELVHSRGIHQNFASSLIDINLCALDHTRPSTFVSTVYTGWACLPKCRSTHPLPRLVLCKSRSPKPPAESKSLSQAILFELLWLYIRGSLTT